MRNRVFSTVGLWLGLIFLVGALGSPALFLIITAAVALAQWELYGLMEKSGYHPMKAGGVCAGIALMLGTWSFSVQASIMIGPGSLGIIGAMILFSLAGLKDGHEGTLRCFAPTLFGILLLPYTSHFMILLLRIFPGWPGVGWVVWIIAVSKFTDVGALLFGRRFGRRPFSPTISPNKTWEGVLGGLVTGILAGVAVCLLFSKQLPESLGIFQVSFLSLPVALSFCFSLS